MKKLLIILAVFLTILGGSTFLLPRLVSTDQMVALLTKQVKAHTGRDLTIAGDVNLAVWPNLAVEAKDVKLSNATWAADPTMVSMERLALSLKLLPLLSRELVVDELLLVKPIIFLEKNQHGIGNWQFAPEVADLLLSRTRQLASTEATIAEPALAGLTLSRFAIEGGTVNYQDAATGKAQSLHHLAVDLSVKALDAPLTIKASTEYQGQAIQLSGSVNSIQQWLDGKAPSIKLDVNAAGLHAVFDGALATATRVPNLQGNIALETPSLRKLLASFGIQPNLPEAVLNATSMKGALRASEAELVLDPAHIKLDAVEVDGSIRVNLAANTPAIRMELSSDALDLTPYMAEKPAKTSSWMVGDAYAAATPYSTEPLDLSALLGADVGSKLKLGKVTFGRFVAEQVTLNTSVRGGRLEVDVPAMRLYGGNGQLNLGLTAGSAPALELESKLQGVAVEPLLRALAEKDTLSGTGNMVLHVMGQGGNLQSIMNSLSGNADIRLKDGKIKGIDLAQALRDLKATLNPARDTSSRSTDFAEFGGSFIVQKGIAHTADLAMMAPFARLTGEGDINLAMQTLDMSIRPKLVSSLKGQGGELEQTGLAIPFRVTGSFQDPAISPDVNAIAKEALKPENIQKAIENPESVKDTIKNVGEQLKGLF